MATPSFPDVHVTGAVHHYIRTGGDGNPIYYLGTAEVTPQMQIRRYRQSVMNDIAGKTLPLQKTYDGDAATVSCLLTRFSKAALRVLAESGRGAGVHLSPGEESRWSRGSLVYGKSAFELWQVYDDFLNPNGTTVGLEIGFYWPQVELLQNDKIKVGTQGEGDLCVFDCTPYWFQFGDRGWTLYSHDENLFPADVRVPQ